MNAPLLLIGATGQIGRNIMQRAQARHVVALARRPQMVANTPQTTTLGFDLNGNLEALPESLPSLAIATTPIWRLSPHLDILADRGTQRLVCFSSTSVFGKSESRNTHERAAVDRIAEAERFLEAKAGRRGIGLTILRPTLIYGEGQDKTISAAGRFIGRFGFYPVHGAALGKRQPVHADDLAAAALAALNHDATIGRTYALGGGETLNYRDMIARIFTVLGKPVRITAVPFLPGVLDVAGRILPGSELTGDVARRMNIDLDFDEGAAARDFGYAPRSFLQGGKADLTGPEN